MTVPKRGQFHAAFRVKSKPCDSWVSALDRQHQAKLVRCESASDASAAKIATKLSEVCICSSQRRSLNAVGRRNTQLSAT